jgi:hypothetical protein
VAFDAALSAHAGKSLVEKREYGHTNAPPPVSITALCKLGLQSVASTVNLLIAVILPRALRIDCVERPALLKFSVLITQFLAGLTGFSLLFAGFFTGLLFFLAARIKETLSALLALGNRWIVLNHRRFNFYLNGTRLRRFAKMHLPVGVGPAINLCGRNTR